MGSNSKCGLNQNEREEMLRRCGFERVRSGKGSHERWENAELKMLARTQKIVCPSNLLSTPDQNAWETTLCDNPANGTWRSMLKHIEWCQKTVEEIKAKSEHERQRCNLVKQFRKAVGDLKNWKHDVKRRFKAGHPEYLLPAAPLTPQEFLKLKNQLSPATP